MSNFDRIKRKRLGDLLVDEGVAPKEAIIEALHEQQRSQRMLSDILLEAEAINEYGLARTLVGGMQAPFIDLSGYSLHKDLVQSFPAALLHEYALIPLDRFGHMLVFACQEIPGADAMEKLKPHAAGGIHFYIALSAEIRRFLAELAPVEKKEAAPEKKAAIASDEDAEWKSLFDSANEEVLADITNPDEP